MSADAELNQRMDLTRPEGQPARLDAAIHGHGRHTRLIELTSRKDIDQFLRSTN